MSTRDELAGVLADTINKQFKDMKVAYFLDGTDTTPTDIKDFVSTGSTMLDLAISNKPDGGIAVGRITELNGLESSGKSLIGAHILAETQMKGGVAVYIDTETAVSTEFLESIGVDVQSMLYLHLETVEDIFSAIEEIVAKVRESDKDRLVTILVDSLAASNSTLVVAAASESTRMVTNLSLSDSLTLATISSIAEKISSTVSKCKYNILFTSTPIEPRNSVLTAVSVSI